MKYGKWLIGSCLALASWAAPAQSIMEVYDKPCSVGVRVGFNSTFPVIHPTSRELGKMQHRDSICLASNR